MFDWLVSIIEAGAPAIVGAILGAIITLFVSRWWRGKRNDADGQKFESRIEQLKAERDQLETQLAAEQAKYETKIEDLESANRELKAREGAVDHRLTEMESMPNAEVWAVDAKRDVAIFRPAGARPTRFLSVLNIKGGVGKTTVTANLGASLAHRGQRVLLVDLDLQGSLSNLCTRPDVRKRCRSHFETSDQLLRIGADVGTVEWLSVGHRFNDDIDIIVADDHLHRMNFCAEARFTILDQEIRDNFRRMFHRDSLFERYDYVLFDCPPRLTASTINALFASDFVLIPTSLHDIDVDSITQTLVQVDALRRTDDFRAEVAGVVVNRASSNSIATLQKAEREHLEDLNQMLTIHSGGQCKIFESLIRQFANTVPPVKRGGEPRDADEKRRESFDPLAEELLHRIGVAV